MYISLRTNPAGPERPATRRRVSSVVITLGIVSLLTDISSESVSAILPIYITGVLGLSTIVFGVLDGLYQGVSALVRIGGGWAADRYDRPKQVAIAGYAISAIARVGLIFAAGFGALAAVLTADRIGKGIRTAPRDAMIARASHPNNLAASFGMHRMLDTIGAALGPLVAFAILILIPDGYSTIFVVSVGFATIGVAVLALAVPATRRVIQNRDGERSGFRWRQLAHPALRRLLIASGLLGIVTIGDGFIYLLLQSRGGFEPQWFPLLYVATNVAFLVLAVPLGRVADRVGRARIFLLGHLALLAAYIAAAAPTSGLWTTLLCLGLLGAFYASTDGILAALASRVTPPEAVSTGIAAAQTVVAMTRLVAAIGFGVLWYLLGPSSAAFIAAGCLVVALPAAALLLRGATR